MRAQFVTAVMVLTLLTGCAGQERQNLTETRDATGAGVNSAEIAERYADAGITEVREVDVATFTTFFEDQAALLDKNRYVARYVVDAGTEVTVDRRPDRMTATIVDAGTTVTFRVSADAALLCDTRGCVTIAEWLADPYRTDAPTRAGRSAAQWWDLFTETGAHDPATLSYIPSVAQQRQGRIFHLGTRNEGPVGTLRCAGYTDPEDLEVMTWCFTADGIWASGPSGRSTLVEITAS